GVRSHRATGGHAEPVAGTLLVAWALLVAAADAVLQGAGAEQGGGHDQRLGHLGVLDGLGVGRGTQVPQVKIGGCAEIVEELACAVQFQPRLEHSGTLGTLTGAEKCNHCSHPSVLAPQPGTTDRTRLSGTDCWFPTKLLYWPIAPPRWRSAARTPPGHPSGPSR